MSETRIVSIIPYKILPARLGGEKGIAVFNEYVGQLGREPQIWFYSQTQASSGFLYSYPLIEKHKYAPKMIEQYIQETELHHPNWFLYTNIHEEEGNPESEKRLKTWAQTYLQDFELKAVLYKKDKLKALFDETNIFAVDTSREVSIEVYQRKTH